MRATRRHRLLRRVVVRPGHDVNLAETAERVSYIGSQEHKDSQSFAGTRSPRPDASICPPHLTQELVTQWLRRAIEGGMIGELWEGEFPRYAWHREGDVVYEGRLVNRGLGQYKGYPLNKTEWPLAMDSRYE
jgi:hypothetical protein